MYQTVSDGPIRDTLRQRTQLEDKVLRQLPGTLAFADHHTVSTQGSEAPAGQPASAVSDERAG